MRNIHGDGMPVGSGSGYAGTAGGMTTAERMKIGGGHSGIGGPRAMRD